MKTITEIVINKPDRISDNLNENQRRAVEWNDGPLLVLAGPGSGKTRVLTLRIARIIQDSPGKRFRVLGLTFTNKAAAEMRNRVEELIPECRDRVLLTTFHSFCADILRQHGSHIGLRPDFTILTQDADREAVLGDVITALRGKNFEVDQSDIRFLHILDYLAANLATEADIESSHQDKNFTRKVTTLYSEYGKNLISHNQVDFPYLILFTHQLMSTKLPIAKLLQIVYPYVCVDEFQDTNLAQYMILKDIVGQYPKDLFVVADDDQIIYQWNGASPERLLNLQNDFNMQALQLPANYRCPPEVIILANQLIKNNPFRANNKKPIVAMKESQTSKNVHWKIFPSMGDELHWIALNIASLHNEEHSDCVILARNRKLLNEVAAILANNGLQAYLSMRKNEFTSAPLRWLHAILRLANARNDREQLRRVCQAFYDIERIVIRVDDIIAKSVLYNGDFIRCWFNEAVNKQIDDRTVKFLTKGLKQIVDRLDLIPFTDNAFNWLSEKNDLLSDQNDSGFVDFEDEKNIWSELQSRIIKQYGKEEVTLNVFLQELDLSEKILPSPPNSIRCLTIHNAKGLEFKHVYLIGMAEGLLPSYQSIKEGSESREMQEERRSCFVAITRTQETLTLTCAREYFGWKKEPSRFLKEMGLIS